MKASMSRARKPRQSRWIGFACLLVAGCGSSVDPPLEPISLTIGPVAPVAAAERTVCVRLGLGLLAEASVTSLLATMPPFARRMVVYRAVDHNVRREPYACTPFDFFDGRTEDVSTRATPPADQLWFVAEGNTSGSLVMPPAVGLPVTKGETLRIELTMTAATPRAGGAAVKDAGGEQDAMQVTEGRLVVALLRGAPVKRAGAFFCGSVSGLLAEGQTVARAPGIVGRGPGPAAGAELTLPVGFWMPPAPLPVHLLALGAHQGTRGLGMTVEKSRAADEPGTLLATTVPGNGIVKTFVDPNFVDLTAGDGLRWLCTYPSSGTEGELCFVSAVYFPAAKGSDSTPPWSVPGCWQ